MASEITPAPDIEETNVVFDLEERVAKWLWDKSRDEENTPAVAPDIVEEGSIASDNEESMARSLWNKFRNESFVALHNPFMVVVASGRLQTVTFHIFTIQELHFLKCYINAFAFAAEEYSDDDYAKISIKILIEELKNLVSFLNRGRISLLKASPATVKYTDFLLETASKEVPVHTLSALMPHLQLYAFIGKELRAVLDANRGRHPFKRWINYYSSDTFQVSTLQAMVLLDRLCVALTWEDLDIIQGLYRQAMKFELDIFCPHPVVLETLFPCVVPLLKELRSSDRQILLFSSFDFTCTVVDSSDILERISIEKALELDQVHSQDHWARIPSDEMRNTWELLRRECREEYGGCIESIVNTKYKITSDGERNYAIVKEALEQISLFEKRANSRLIESGVLKGWNLEDIKRAGERLILLDDCISFFQSIIKNENTSESIHVLSHCWCNDLIKSAFSSGTLHTLDIQANELIYKESITTGGMMRKVESPFDKLEHFSNILERTNNNGRKYFSVYVGHSISDLLCLLKADIGIVIGSNDCLRRVGDSFGIRFAPLLDAFVQMQREMLTERLSGFLHSVRGTSGSWTGRLSGSIYTASCWAEIQSLFVGLKTGFGLME